MAIVSFALTKTPFCLGIKTKTRRRFKDSQFNMWLNQWKRHPDKIHTAVDKQLCYGGKIIGYFRQTACPYKEKLGDMPENDLLAEGGLWKTVDEFIEFIKGDPEEIVTVITFKKIDSEQVELFNDK